MSTQKAFFKNIYRFGGTITRIKTRHLLPGLIGASLSLAAEPASAEARSATVIDPPNPFGSTNNYLYGVNNSGQIAGNFAFSGDSSRHAFLYSNGNSVDIGTLGGKNSYPRAINETGTVVGWADFSPTSYHSRAFIFQNGVLRDLGTLGGPSSAANAINDSHVIAGDSTNAAGQNHAVIFSNTGVIDLGTLGGANSYTVDMNNRGEVAGWSDLINDRFNRIYHAFLYTGGVMRDLGTLGGSTSEAKDVNESGQVTGYARLAGDNTYHAFLYNGNTMIDLGTLGGSLSEGYAINDSGQVVGWAYNASNQQRAFLASVWGNTDLGTLGGSTSEAKDINNLGQVVGQAETDIVVTVPYPYDPYHPNEGGSYSYRVSHAFLYENGQMIDLNNLLPPNSGWEIMDAHDINDAGYILCSARLAGESQTRSVIVKLNNNRTPIAQPDVNYTLAEDSGSITIPVLENDSDPDGDPITIGLSANGPLLWAPSNGTVRLSEDGRSFVYTPNPDFNGTEGFGYYVTDGSVNSSNVWGTGAWTWVSVETTPQSDAPVAQNSSISTNEDTIVRIFPYATDVDRDALTYEIVTPPHHGVLTPSYGAPGFFYTPTADYNGPDSFTFKANDGALQSNTATVSITVKPVNDAPVAANQAITTDEDTAANITLSATDVDSGTTLTYSIVGAPQHGTLSGTAPNLTYTPAANYKGSDSFTFKANDRAADSNTAKVTITIEAKNDAPGANSQNIETDEDTAKSITLTASDADGNSLEYSIVDTPSQGTLSGAAPNLVYTPAANYNGSDSFSFKVSDGTLESNVATVSIKVREINDAPQADNNRIRTEEDTPVSIQLTGSDIDSSGLTYVALTPPQQGTLSGIAPNLTYTPKANYHGEDSLTFKINDGNSDSNTATVNITVVSVNDAPIASTQEVETNEETALNINLQASDPDGNVLTYNVNATTQHGTLSGTAPNLVYTPKANFSGSDSFSFVAHDGTANSNTATVKITVKPVNDAPVASTQNVTLLEDTSKAITLGATDAEGDSLAYIIVTAPLKGVLSGSGSNLTYTPNTNANGPDSFIFKVNDGKADSNTATINLNITPVNDAPIAVNDTASAVKNTAINISVLSNDSDIDGDTLTVSLVTQPANGTVSILNGTSVRYTPSRNFTGTNSFRYTVIDGKGGTASATVTVTVRK